MSAEHRRPLVAFLLVALVCAFTVGQSVRNAALRQLVNTGLPLIALVPIAPDVLFSIDVSSKHGRGGDDPSLGGAIVAASRVPVTVVPVPTGPSFTPVGVPATPVVNVTSHPGTGHPRPTHPPKHHPQPKPPHGQTTTLAAARADLTQARTVARAAALTADRATAVAKACVAKSGADACQTELLDVQEAGIRSSAAATQVAWGENVVGRLLEKINARVSTVRAQAGQVFTARVEKARAAYATVRASAQSDLQATYAALQADYSGAVAGYSTAIDAARQGLTTAGDQRLREVDAYNKQRAAQVEQIRRTSAAMVRAGHVAAARAYRVKAFAQLTRADRVFGSKVDAERAAAAAAYDVAASAAKDALSKAVAELQQGQADGVAQAAAVLDDAKAALSTVVQAAAVERTGTVSQARAEAEATVVIDPSTVPVPSGG